VSNAVAQCSGGNLEDPVGQYESADYPSPALGRNMQFLLDARAGDGDANAVEKGNDGERDQQE
jgi:hypothetical protein